MQEVAPADRADLAGAEEARRGRAQGVLEGRGIVVGYVEHVRAAAIAGEEQRPGGATGAERLRLAAQGLAEILVGGGRIPDLKPHGLPDAHRLADRDRARLAVRTDDRPDQEVAALVLR